VGGWGSTLGLIGLILIFIGRREFGREHHRSVNVGFILFLLSIVFIVIGPVLMVMTFEERGSQLMIGAIAFLITAGVLGSVYPFFLFRHLQDSLGMKVLIAAVVLGIITYATLFGSMGMMQWEQDQTEDKDEREDIRYTYDGYTMGFFALLAASGVLHLLAMANAFWRIHKGKLVPVPDYLNHPPPAYPCPQCGRTVSYMTGHNKWWCEDCGRSF